MFRDLLVQNPFKKAQCSNVIYCLVKLHLITQKKQLLENLVSTKWGLRRGYFSKLLKKSKNQRTRL